MDDRDGPLTQPPLQEVVAMRERTYDGDATRDAILAAVRDEPGISKSDLQRRLDVGWCNLSHHIEVLVRNDLLAVAKSPRCLILHPPEIGEREARWFASCRQDSFTRMVEYMQLNPGDRLTDISRGLRLHLYTVRRHIAALDDIGVLRRSGAYHTRFDIDRHELAAVEARARLYAQALVYRPREASQRG